MEMEGWERGHGAPEQSGTGGSELAGVCGRLAPRLLSDF